MRPIGSGRDFRFTRDTSTIGSGGFRRQVSGRNSFPWVKLCAGASNGDIRIFRRAFSSKPKVCSVPNLKGGQGDKLKRYHFPGVLDVYEVSDPKDIEAVNNDSRIDREFNSRTCPLNWLFVKRSLTVLSYAGNRFPTMKPRRSEARQSAQQALWNRLHLKVPEVKLGPRELEPLAQWVRGYGAGESLGLKTQQILGRLFSDTFVATPESWDAATTLVRAPRSNNISNLIWWSVSGKVRRAKRILASMVNDDLSAVNAIGIAVHNLVKSLHRMRILYADADRSPTLSPADAAMQCLVAPASVFRQATTAGELNGIRFSNNSLFILNIGDAAKLEEPTALVFMRDSWSSCPAEQWVPAMLEGVWLRANAPKLRNAP
jgi:hypothetical protein